MDFKDHWNPVKVGVDEQGLLEVEGLLYTEGLGPCIGLCLAFGRWAGILHSSHTPNDKKEIEMVLGEAKKKIPKERWTDIKPILCGSDPAPDFDEDSDGYEEDQVSARQFITDILVCSGFGSPICHWSEAGQTAAVFADLTRFVITVEVDYEEFRYLIPK